MTSTAADADDPSLADEDRLPWLESAEEEYRDNSSTMRIMTGVIVALLVIAVGIFGYSWWRNQRTATGTGDLIAAPQGPYKVKPDEPGGMKVDGEGDTVFATSEGGISNGSVDTGALPEAPVTGRTVRPGASPGAGTARVVAAVPPPGGALTARTPGAAVPAIAPGGSSSLVQLGSFPSETAANAAWSALSGRIAYLAPLGRAIERAEVGGRTVYRLRVNAGSAGQARELCGKLKVAGEACFVPN